MRKRYDFFIDVAQFPIIALLIAVILLGTGNVLVNPNAALFWKVSSEYVVLASSFLRMLGGTIIITLPLGLLIALLSKRFDDVLASMIGVISFLIIHITTMFFASTKLPAEAYTSVMGIGLGSLASTMVAAASRYPLQIGLLASMVAYYVTKVSYLRTRNKKTYGMFSFVDKNTMALLLAMMYSIVMGLVISYVWPYFVMVLYEIFKFIADDITNPFNLFVFGSVDKLLAVLNLSEIPRATFWFSEFGGTWLDSFGRKYAGDVAIWTAQLASGTMNIGIGRFVTPQYVVNLFAIPGYLVALFSLVSNRFEKRKYFMLLMLAVVASMVCGNSLPIDLFMLCASPLLFFIHVFASSLLYAIFEWAKIFIGFSYSGSALFASVGTLQDLLMYGRSPVMFRSVSILVLVGLGVFLFYFMMTRLYYKYLAIDMFQSGKEKLLVTQLVSALGGLDNIKVIDANILKLLVQVKNDQNVDIMQLRKLCLSKVFESKTGYVLYFYKASPKLYVTIKQQLKLAAQENL